MVMGLIVFGNHYTFRTYNLDLGMFHLAAWDFLHGQPNQAGFLLYLPETDFFLCHFSIPPVFIAFFYPLTGPWTFLIFQILSIIAGALGYFKLATHRQSSFHGFWIATQFLASWGIYSAVASEYHDNVIGMMALPWSIYFLLQKKYFGHYGCWFLFLLSKENLAFMSIPTALGLVILLRKQIPLPHRIALPIISIIWFVLLFGWIFPALDHQQLGPIQAERYINHSGKDFWGWIWEVLQSPKLWLQYLFQNTSGNPEFDGIKIEFWWVWIISGAWLLLLKPLNWIFLFPILAFKLLPWDSYTIWGIGYQYSIEIVGMSSLLLALGSYPKNIKSVVLPWLTVGSLTATILTWENRKSKWHEPVMMQFYKKEHYSRPFDVNHVHQLIKKVPTKGALCASAELGPWLGFRDSAYSFPNYQYAQYIAAMTHGDNTYPLSKKDYLHHLDSLSKSPQWEITLQEFPLLVLKRK